MKKIENAKIWYNKALQVLVIILTTCFTAFTQAPQAFKYQAIARNENGAILINQPISVKITILDTTTPVYSEVHHVITNPYGLINFNVGEGALESGTFADIDWGSANHYIQIDIDESGGTDYKSLGAAPLLSVPYALYAENAGNSSGGDNDSDPSNEIQLISISNDTIYLENGGYVKLPEDKVDDADTDPENELQTISLDGNDLSLSNSGGTLTLPAVGSNLWSKKVNHLLYPDGKVTIGSDTSLFKFNVSGAEGEIGLRVEDYTQLYIGNKNGGQAAINFDASDGDFGGSDYFTIYQDTDLTLKIESMRFASDIIFMTKPNTFNNPAKESMRITTDGYVGVGIATPSRTLHVSDVMRLEPRATEPSSPSEGDIYMNSSVHKLMFYDGTQWEKIPIDDVNDADANPLNEIQTLSLNGNDLSLSNSGGTVTLPTVGSNLWSKKEDNIYYPNGSVTIGTDTSTKRFAVYGNNGLVEYNVDRERVDILVGNKSGGTAGIGLDASDGDFVGSDYFWIYQGTDLNLYLESMKFSGDIVFMTKPNLAHDPAKESMRVTKDGYVGIGVTSPSRTLHVSDVMRLEPRSSAPSNPSEGDMYMDGTTHKLMVYDGTQWQACW